VEEERLGVVQPDDLAFEGGRDSGGPLADAELAVDVRQLGLDVVSLTNSSFAIAAFLKPRAAS
jgi:hypothetical protein